MGLTDSDVSGVDGSEFYIGQTANGTSNALKIDTSNNATFAGNVLPSAHNSKNLGSDSVRWANLYVADMQMSNEGCGGNEVDGTEGNWSMQEGEDDLFVINRKTGKKFKIKLEEM